MEMTEMSRKAHDFTVVLVVILALVVCIPSFGQVVKGSISGSATDPSNAVVPGATVTATNTETGVAYTTTTDSAGIFRINAIPAGIYNVTIKADKFKTAETKTVSVSAGGETGLGKIGLTIGETGTTVEVTGVAPLVDTTSAQVTNTFSGETLSTFAGIQENQGLDRLALFVPGVVSVRSQGFSNTNGAGFSSDGQRGRNNDQEIDGQNNNDNSVGGPALFVSDVNFVQQYVLITNNFGPEYGRNGGSVVNIITKSGGNNWHGALFGTEYSSFLNALSNTGRHQNKPGTNSGLPGTVNCVVPPGGTGSAVQCNPLSGPIRSNEVFGGGTIGGPIVKNKWFLFGGYDNDLFAGNSIFSTTSRTPTPATLAGCYPTGIAAQQIATLAKYGPYGISGGNPQPNSPSNVSFTNVQAPGNSSIYVPAGACPNVQLGGVIRVLPTPFHGFDFVNKVDGQLSSKDNVMARYLFNRGNNFNGSDNPVTGYAANVTALSQAILVSWTRNLTSHMVNEFRVGFDRLNVNFGGNNIGNPFEPPQGGILTALANVTLQGGFLGFGPATNFPQGRLVNDWQVQDNWNYVVGKHQFKAGVNWTYQRSPNTFLPNINGAYRYSNFAAYLNGTSSASQPVGAVGLNRIQIAQGNPVLDFREYDTFFYGG